MHRRINKSMFKQDNGMSITFKNYCAMLQEADDASVEQLDEIFGKFFGKDQPDRAAEAKAAFLKRKADAEEKKKKEEERRAKLAGRPEPSSNTYRSKAAQDRKADHDWVDQLTAG